MAKQFGTDDHDEMLAIAVDETGAIGVAGFTFGALGGPPAGDRDAVIVKLDASGVMQWARKVASHIDDIANGVTMRAGFVYAAGQYLNDAFVVKYTSAGSVVWLRQVGTPGIDIGSCVTVDDADQVYLSGWTFGNLGAVHQGQGDAFLAKLNAQGVVQWVRQIGTPMAEQANAVSLDNHGYATIVGLTWGTMDGSNSGAGDVFAAKYDANGNWQWTRQFGSNMNDVTRGAGHDSRGNLYLTGWSEGLLGGPTAGGVDVFTARLGTDGSIAWIKRFGSSASDLALDMAIDQEGNSYIAGQTEARLGGPYTNGEGRQVFLAKCNDEGLVLWTRQIGTFDDDLGRAVAIDESANAYVTGATTGDLAGPNAGGSDAFVLKFGSPACLGDLIGYGQVDVNDLLAIINHWGNCPPPSATCPMDIARIGGDGTVSVIDLLMVINNWGDCPAAFDGGGRPCSSAATRIGS